MPAFPALRLDGGIGTCTVNRVAAARRNLVPAAIAIEGAGRTLRGAGLARQAADGAAPGTAETHEVPPTATRRPGAPSGPQRFGLAAQPRPVRAPRTATQPTDALAAMPGSTWMAG